MIPASSPMLPRDLGGGLTLRRSVRADAEALADFNKMIHRDPPATEPDELVAAWTRDLFRTNHPTVGAGDLTLVEEVATGRIVSTTSLISQTWSYAGIPFAVGRPELVGTLPEYRRRGLVRLQFDVLHAWSAARGEMVQAITGIPYYYRQFGYEMAMLFGGGQQGNVADVPKLKDGGVEAYRLRAVVEADLPFILELDAHAAHAHLVYCPRDAALWRYELWGKSEKNANRLEWLILEKSDGGRVGLLGHAFQLWGARLAVLYLNLLPGVSWLGVAPSVLRGVKALGEAMAGREGKPCAQLYFGLGERHPFYQANRFRLPEARRPYAWYLRVADLPGFVRQIAPALAARLASSLAAGHTGELKLNFYREGLRLAFADGRIVVSEPWTPAHAEDGAAGFPPLTFLQLLFGYRSLDELRSAFPDCWQDGNESYALLNSLFPKQPSHFWPLA